METTEGRERGRPEALLLKAIRGLAPEEQKAVLEFLVAAAVEAVPGLPAEVARRAGRPVHGRPRPGPGAFTPTPLEFHLLRLAGEGLSASEAGERLNLSEAAVKAHLRMVGDIADPLGGRESKVLDLLARGRTRAEAAAELGVPEETVAADVEALLDREARRWLHAGRWGGAQMFVPPSLPGGRGALGAGQQMLPVRLSESAHQRLKDWCEQHGFSMAVVIRGLVERFLDGQDRRAS